MNSQERKSKNHIRSHINALLKKLGTKTPPLLLKEIIKILKANLKLNFYIASKALSNKISGIYVKSNNNVGIMYNSSHPKVRVRFTIAHEIGHLILEHNFRQGEHQEIYNLKDEDPHETEANIFAAELLMPFYWLKEDMQKEQISIKELSKRYWVSEEAMGWRLAKSDALLLTQ